jgi:hypothetical protein
VRFFAGTQDAIIDSLLEHAFPFCCPAADGFSFDPTGAFLPPLATFFVAFFFGPAGLLT